MGLSKKGPRRMERIVGIVTQMVDFKRLLNYSCCTMLIAMSGFLIDGLVEIVKQVAWEFGV